MSAKSCLELLQRGETESKAYEIELGDRTVKVFCDMNDDQPRGGGWTIIQRRGDNGKPQDFFLRGWEEYKVKEQADILTATSCYWSIRIAICSSLVFRL